MYLRTLIFIGFALASVLCQAVGVGPTSQNHGMCDARVHGEAVCQSVSLLQTGTIRHQGKDHGHENNDDHDHDENSTIAINGPASDSIALQLGGGPIPCRGPRCTSDKVASESAGGGWRKVFGHRIYMSEAAYPQTCTSIPGNKRAKGYMGKGVYVPNCMGRKGLTLDEAKKVCQSMSDCKSFTQSWGHTNYWSKGEPLDNMGRGTQDKSTVTYIKGDNDNKGDNENMGPDLGIAKDLVQNLKKFSESTEKQLANVATKDDLKKVVHKLEEHFQEQMNEAGKHVLENRKYIERIGHVLESIIKSGSSRRRRRK